MLYLGGEYPPRGAPANKRGRGLKVSEVHAIIDLTQIPSRYSSHAVGILEMIPARGLGDHLDYHASANTRQSY